MTLVSIRSDMTKARLGRYAIPLWDIFDLEGMEGAMDALTAKRAPTIIAIYSEYAAHPNAKAFAAYIRQRASDTDIPVTLMLDHGSSVDLCLRALDLGFTDVMYDGSSLPIEENIAKTCRVVAAAHACGAAVEAELGHVGFGDTYDQYGGQRLGFTDPSLVDRFVAETGVDFLAIAFGNAHGLYKGLPCLDLELVKEIRARVPIPLVMHGGTGLSDDQFRAAIAAGICKINYSTGILNRSVANLRQAAQSGDATMFSIIAGIRTAFREECSRLYDVFGTSGKA